MPITNLRWKPNGVDVFVATRVANVVIIIPVTAAGTFLIRPKHTHTAFRVIGCAALYGDLLVGGTMFRHMLDVLPPWGGINFIVLLQGLTNCTTHSHTLAHKKNTHPRTRHNLKHAFQGTLIGISGKVDVSYLPLLCHSPG